jgi:D-serine deaminase-like pyridoxal phosphate-dependent protein
VPNHACMTAAMYEEYLVTDGGSDIVARWPRTNGWG